MNTTIESLQALYVKNGGNLTDTYSDICGGAAVRNYTTIPDMVAACAKLNIGGGGGGAEKFVVTLTKAEGTWTADKTIAEIAAAKAANKTIVANYLDSYELPCLTAESAEGYSLCFFSGIVADGGNVAISVFGESDGSADAWELNTTPIPTSSNAPLIVTMTAGATEGQYVGDKTIGEIKTAFEAGRNVVVTIPARNISVSVIQVVIDDSDIVISTGDKDVTFIGAASEYASVTL